MTVRSFSEFVSRDIYSFSHLRFGQDAEMALGCLPTTLTSAGFQISPLSDMLNTNVSGSEDGYSMSCIPPCGSDTMLQIPPTIKTQISESLINGPHNSPSRATFDLNHETYMGTSPILSFVCRELRKDYRKVF
ncbi:unnamed protein product [Alternaria burnsii]|nr:unnamed protein product [Alternaria burnsii]